MIIIYLMLFLIFFIGAVLALFMISGNSTEKLKAPTSLKKNFEPVTMIISASPVPSHPETICMEKILSSVFSHIKGNVSKIILAHDIIPDDQCDKKRMHACYPKKKREEFKDTYPKYLESLKKYLEMNTFDIPIEFVQAETWGGLTGNINNAMKLVETKYVMLVQHDLEFVRDIDVNSIVADMQQHPDLKMVQFNKDHNNVFHRDPKKTGILQACHNLGKAPKDQGFGDIKKTENNTFIKTPCWTDQNHLTTTDYWRDVVYPLCEPNLPRFMEYTMNKLSPFDSVKFGTWVWSPEGFNSKKTIHHFNCRRKKPIFFK